MLKTLSGDLKSTQNNQIKEFFCLFSSINLVSEAKEGLGGLRRPAESLTML